MKRTSFQRGCLTLVQRRLKPPVWVLRYRDSQGRHNAKQIGTIEEFPTKADAWKACFPVQISANIHLEMVTFGQLCHRFEKEEMSARLCSRSAEKSRLKRLKTEFGEQSLQWMVKNRLRIREWLNSLNTLPTETRPSRPMRTKSKQEFRALLHNLFQKAMLWDYIELQINPIELIEVKAPLWEQPFVRKVVPRALLFELLEDAKLPIMIKLMILIAMMTGIRGGEILGLKWNAVDFEKGVIHIRISHVMNEANPPKSRDSRAEVPMGPELAAELRAWKAYRETQMRNGARTKAKHLGIDMTPLTEEEIWGKQGWVFANPATGNPFWLDSLQDKYLRPAGLRLGITDLGWHSFRHTFKDALDQLEEPLEVQRQLMRHSSEFMAAKYGKGGNKMPKLKIVSAKLADWLSEGESSRLKVVPA